MDTAAFVAASLLLLGTPGPTNSLLAASGAANGVRSSLHLLAAELVGYLNAILLLRICVGPIVSAVPALAIALQALVAAYLIYLAAKLWGGGRQGAGGDPGPVTFPRVFITTVLNPKAIIFAFALLPLDTDVSALSLRLGLLVLLITAAGATWVALGAFLRLGLHTQFSLQAGYRASALTLVAFAGLFGARAIHLM